MMQYIMLFPDLTKYKHIKLFQLPIAARIHRPTSTEKRNQYSLVPASTQVQPNGCRASQSNFVVVVLVII